MSEELQIEGLEAQEPVEQPIEERETLSLNKEEPQEEQKPGMAALSNEEAQAAFAKKQEETARRKGWMPYEEWVEKGKNPHAWAPADYYNLKGKLMDEMQQKFDSRLDRVNQMHEVQLKQQLEDLNAQRVEAMRQGGEEAVKTVGDIEQKMANLSQAQQPQANDPFLDQYNRDNPWITEETPKGNYGRTVFQRALQMGAGIRDAVTYMEMEVKKVFPDEPAPRKDPVPKTERGSRPGAKAKSTQKLTMADLTPAERRQVSSFKGWDEKKMLETVADIRRGNDRT